MDASIAYILHTTSTSDGSSKSFCRMLKYLVSQGIRPVLVFPDKGELYQQFMEAGYVTIATTYRPMAYPHFRSFKEAVLFLPRLCFRLIADERAKWILVHRFKKERVQLIHSNVSVLSVGYRVARSLRIPHVYHVREYAMQYGFNLFPTEKRFYKKLETSNSFSIFITNDLFRSLRQESNPRARVIYNPIVSDQSCMPKEPKAGYFMYAGRMEYVKGFDMLLLGYANYVKHASNILPLYVAGSFLTPSYQNQIDTIIRDHKLQDYVKFLGRREDVLQLMARANATIVSSRFEGFGRTMAEAQAQGCLVIGYDNTGTKEQFDNGVRLSGQEIGLRYHDVKSLEECLTEVSAHPSAYFSEMRERAFKTVQALYSVESHGSSVMTFYRSVFEGQHGPMRKRKHTWV